MYFILFFNFFNLILFLNLKHCISFAKHQNESATGISIKLLKVPFSSLTPISFLDRYGQVTSFLSLSPSSFSHCSDYILFTSF